jgi:uncharacterized protein
MSRPLTEQPSPADPSPFAEAAGGLRVRVRVTPRARRTGILGLRTDPDGRPRLEVAVGAPPEDGRANAAVLALLAREWRLPKSALSVLAGTADRRKTIGIAGDSRHLFAAMADWLQTRRRQRSL